MVVVFAAVVSELPILPGTEPRELEGCGKPAATESRYPTLINYKVHAGSFRVCWCSPAHTKTKTKTTTTDVHPVLGER